MPQLCPGDHAPDFTLPDHTDQPITLSDVRRARNVLLVFNLGFA